MIEKQIRRTRLARQGEQAAVDYYLARGFRVLARNWRAGRFAEVDLIVEAPFGLIVFAEVKTRSGTGQCGNLLATGFDSITLRKQQKIVTAARIYLARKALGEVPCRFDVLVINWHQPGSPNSCGAEAQPCITFVADAFNA